MKQALNKIVDCLVLIADNPNVYSRELASEIKRLSEIIEETKEE